MRNYIGKISRLFFIIFTYIISPLLFTFIFLRKRKQKDLCNSRILIVPQLTRIGDLVCTTPVFRAIKEKYPHNYVAVLVSSRGVGIIKNNPHIDEIIIYEDYSFWQLLKKIRKSFFDWSFLLSATSVSTIFSMWGLIKNRVKTIRFEPPVTERLTDWMNNYRLLYKNHTYLPNHHLELLSFIDIKNPKEVKEVFITKEGNNKVEWFLMNNDISAADKLIGISITAGNKAKEWGDEKFYKLAQQIKEKYNIKIVFISTFSDRKRIDNLLKHNLKDIFYKVSNFSLEELPSLIKKLDLFISVDTGPIHIAHALGVPLIDIIGPVDSVELTPRNKISKIVRPDSSIPPSIFSFKKAGSFKDTRRAIDSISVERVLAAVDNLLNI